MVSPRPLLAILMLVPLLAAPASAESVADINLRFAPDEGLDAVQPGCTTFSFEHNPCHQIATMMNGLDSPKIDVLILVPASPLAERDLRMMRQSTEMWADGIHYLAGDMGLPWLQEGLEFHIFMEMVNTGESEFTTYPIVDPEIVIIASNPVGGIGIGIDPLDFAGILFGEGAGQGPCHGVANPFDMAAWENLPGYDSHHGGRSGTYTEDCGGTGGNICFSVNAAVEPPVPQDVIDFQLYDLVSHETGHCLTLGHVGDGAEGAWSSVPTNDIMAYSSDPPGVSKCVSTLNVEALAVSMSRYLDVNADGVVNSDDYIHPNDAVAEGEGRPFQIQHPDNHYYASPTRQAIDCPQPDAGFVPLSEVENFTPLAPLRPQLQLLANDQPVQQGRVAVQGVVTGASAGSVLLNVTFAPSVNATEDAPVLRLANLTVPIVAGQWSGAVDLSQVAVGQTVVVAALWLADDGTLLDADRVSFLVDSPVKAGQAGDGTQDAPALPVAFLAMALAVLAVARRRK